VRKYELSLILCSIILCIYFSTSHSENWINIDSPDGTKSFIDTDSIKKEGDKIRYRLKFIYNNNYYGLLLYVVNCKEKWQKAIEYLEYDKNNIIIKSKSFLRSENDAIPVSILPGSYVEEELKIVLKYVK
jgi:hypothetical protein